MIEIREYAGPQQHILNDTHKGYVTSFKKAETKTIQTKGEQSRARQNQNVLSNPGLVCAPLV